MPEPPLHTPLGTPFIELESVDSTNNYAFTSIHAGLAQAGTAIFAHQQLAGKGQRGKTWLSEKGNSLSLSVIIDPKPLTIARQFELSACIAVTVCELVSRYTVEEMKIKWPNDIYWHDRKAGGILTESIIGKVTEPGYQQSISSWKWAVAGIGLNINQAGFPPVLKNAVSLRQITGRNFLPVAIAREICTRLDTEFYNMLSNGFENIFERFNNLLYKKNEMVRLKKGNRNFGAQLKGVSPTGMLIVDHGIETSFAVGEVELLPG